MQIVLILRVGRALRVCGLLIIKRRSLSRRLVREGRQVLEWPRPPDLKYTQIIPRAEKKKSSSHLSLGRWIILNCDPELVATRLQFSPALDPSQFARAHLDTRQRDPHTHTHTHTPCLYLRNAFGSVCLGATKAAGECIHTQMERRKVGSKIAPVCPFETLPRVYTRAHAKQRACLSRKKRPAGESFRFCSLERNKSLRPAANFLGCDHARVESLPFKIILAIRWRLFEKLI